MTLEGVDVIFAEDTRRALALLQWAGIGGKPLRSLHEHNESTKLTEVLEVLRAGRSVALISDAGTPLIADPGYRVVAACRQEGVRVSVVPGPCAPVVALAGSGISPYPFLFLGFLPRKRGDVLALFTEYASVRTTLVFFERKNRVGQTLVLAYEALGERDFCLARELTKKHEEFINGRLGQALEHSELLGEVTVVIGPPERAAVSSREEILALLRKMDAVPGHPKDKAKMVQRHVQGWTVKQIYEVLIRRETE